MERTAAGERTGYRPGIGGRLPEPTRQPATTCFGSVMTQDMQAASAFAAKAFKAACLAELEALKPGNVHIFADGHGMVVQDFLQSAEAAQVIAEPGLTVGQRILAAGAATRRTVSHNTNLGMILLCAPLIHAFLKSQSTLREERRDVLQDLTVGDAELAYRARVIAS